MRNRKRFVLALGVAVAIVSAFIIAPWVRARWLMAELRGTTMPSRKIELIADIGRERLAGAVPALVDTWVSDARQPEIRGAIRRAVAAIGAGGASVLARLTRELDESTALAAIDLLGRVGADGRRALSTLVALLEDDRETMRGDAIWAIARIGVGCGASRRGELVSAIQPLCRDEHWRVRTRAKWAVAVLRDP